MCDLQLLYGHKYPKILDCSDTTSKITKAGKIRGMQLPLEYDLERMVSNIENPLPSWNASVPAHKWKGVICSGDAILKFEAESKLLRGTLSWSTLPRSLTRLSVYSNKLSGDIELENLPPKLSSLNASYNRFTGNVDLCNLPVTLNALILSENELYGHVTFTNLPSVIVSLSLRNNVELTGTVHLHLLPISIRYKTFTNTKITVLD